MATRERDLGLDRGELQSIVRSEIENAVDFIESDVGSDRAESTEFYRGEPLGNEEEGRSQIVTRDVRDAVRQILPSLMRVFFGAERAVEFVPNGPEDVRQAEQATDYVNYILLQDNPGFEVFHSVFKDSLYNKTGIVKYWLDESVEVTYHEFSGLNDAALGLLVNDPGVEPVEIRSQIDPNLPQEAVGQMLAQGVPPPEIHEGTVRRTRRNPKIRIEAVPPEEFLINRTAKNLEDARYVGHRTLMAFTDLVALGYDPDFLEDHIHTTSRLSQATELNTRFDDLGGFVGQDTHNEAERPILYTESYIRVDVDGDGIGELRRICTIGTSHEIVADDPVQERPFAAFCPDPEPHLFFGDDIADQTKDIQKIRTMVTRSLLDGLAQTIHPRTWGVEGQVNFDDLLNTEVGAVIRMGQPGMAGEFRQDMDIGSVLAVLDALEDERDRRVGIHNMALEADALQSTTKSAVQAQKDAATQNLELIARIYAESGMRRLFKGLLKLVVRHQNQPRVVRLRNEFVEVDPRTWNADMDVSVNVGLGHGMTEDRLNTLGRILELQMQAIELGGLPNPMVSLGQIRNTVGKMAELAGFKDTSQFFKPLPVDFDPPPPPDEPSEAELLAQVESQKNAQQAAKDQAELDLKRDELLAEIHLKAAEIRAKHDADVDMDAIRDSIDFNVLFGNGDRRPQTAGTEE